VPQDYKSVFEHSLLRVAIFPLRRQGEEGDGREERGGRERRVGKGREMKSGERVKRMSEGND
jgi:hypothetical protein